MASERTKKCKKLRNWFFAISTLLLIAVLVFTIINVASIFNVPKDPKTGEPLIKISQSLIDKVVAFGTTTVVVSILAIFIKNKARTAIYMLSLIISIIIKGEPGAYFILILWALDEYVFHALYLNYKNKVVINKEIDLR